MNQEKVIIICGPTASGKTDLSIQLAKQIGGEIVSADSMQIYQDMSIGTAKPTKEEMQDIPHHLIDNVLPTERYSVASYQKDAINAIDEILKHKKVPIVVGGTGLYIDSLIYGIEYQDIEIDLSYRRELDQLEEEKGLDVLYQMAEKIDPDAILKVSRNDKKGSVEFLEIYHATGKTKTEIEIESRKKGPKYDYIIFGINMDREKLYDRINKRVDIMLENGLIEEVKMILDKYTEFPTAMQGLGYKEVVEYLNQEISENEMIEKLKMETRRYAKRQFTWFRKYEHIIWLDGLDNVQNNIKIILEEYDRK